MRIAPMRVAEAGPHGLAGLLGAASYLQKSSCISRGDRTWTAYVRNGAAGFDFAYASDAGDLIVTTCNDKAHGARSRQYHCDTLTDLLGAYEREESLRLAKPLVRGMRALGRLVGIGREGAEAAPYDPARVRYGKDALSYVVAQADPQSNRLRHVPGSLLAAVRTART